MYEEDTISYEGPCFLMRSLISSLSDGTLTGIRRWFIQRHLKDCPKCSDALATLVVIQARLRAMGLPRPVEEEGGKLRLHLETRSRLFAQWDEIDRSLPISAKE